MENRRENQRRKKEKLRGDSGWEEGRDERGNRRKKWKKVGRNETERRTNGGRKGGEGGK